MHTIHPILAYNGQYYFLNPNQLSWEQAQTYCESHCNSELASIHDETQNSMAIAIIDNILDTSNTANVWIGLNATKTIWSDGTALDYGATTTQWSSYGNCVKISSQQQEHVWDNDACVETYVSLCNSCDSKLSKYGVLLYQTGWRKSCNDCHEHYGSEWASIHSAEDYNDAWLLAKIVGTVWIGLNDKETEDEWLWSDETTFDYFSDSSKGQWPWASGEPDNGLLYNENCVKLRQKDGLVYDEDCAGSSAPERYPLCNAPSELCHQQYWNEVISTASIISFHGTECDLKINSTEGDTLLIMENNEWLNHGQTLRIHYMFNIESDTTGDTGVVIDFKNASCFYYAGVKYTGSQYILFIGRMEGSNFNELSQAQIQISLNTYYELEIEVDAPNSWWVSINNDVYISYYDDSRNQTIFSGYIGVKNHGLLSNAKSLFVSGSKVPINTSPSVPNTTTTTTATSIAHTTTLSHATSISGLSTSNDGDITSTYTANVDITTTVDAISTFDAETTTALNITPNTSVEHKETSVVRMSTVHDRMDDTGYAVSPNSNTDDDFNISFVLFVIICGIFCGIVTVLLSIVFHGRSKKQQNYETSNKHLAQSQTPMEMVMVTTTANDVDEECKETMDSLAGVDTVCTNDVASGVASGVEAQDETHERSSISSSNYESMYEKEGVTQETGAVQYEVEPGKETLGGEVVVSETAGSPSTVGSTLRL